jgi:hypothetical protein
MRTQPQIPQNSNRSLTPNCEHGAPGPPRSQTANQQCEQPKTPQIRVLGKSNSSTRLVKVSSIKGLSII